MHLSPCLWSLHSQVSQQRRRKTPTALPRAHSGVGGPGRAAAYPDCVPSPCQLSGTSGDRQGSLVTYSLFLQMPFHGHGQCVTAPRRKLFSRRNLKMTLFHSDVC